MKLFFNGEYTISFWTQDDQVTGNDATIVGGLRSNPLMRIRSPGPDNQIAFKVANFVFKTASQIVNSVRTHWSFRRTDVPHPNGWLNMRLRIYKNGEWFKSFHDSLTPCVITANNIPFSIGYNVGNDEMFKDKTLQDF